MNKILVTGGAGYIGSVLSRRLLNNGYKVKIYDNFNFSDASIIDIKDNPNLEVIKADIRDTNNLEKALKILVSRTFLEKGNEADLRYDFANNN